ncbi:tautomerase family protein [Polyangium jinanense]|uniref:Tautomerase n=1 Tax=Polyangium jinanense TaxID=2829994 RepID=A0A9X3XHE9_9BACT|nr:4-oxalocrotonate tautomerase family protein [Polyangium jinanense]MDC3959789.1 4-oxalocrotonate tautomerase family protein [Polyangium jinanense]MDC3988066.1 4-oxalocrotonate tautomerase family protein [Polyangium jinanense]
MPYINVKITKGSATPKQKAEIIAGMTNVLRDVIDKAPEATFVVIDEVEHENWGAGGLPVLEYWKKTGKSASASGKG